MTCEKCQNGWINTKNGFIVCECNRDKTLNKMYEWSEAPPKYKKQLIELEDQKIKNGKGTIVSYKESIERLTKNRENIEMMIENEFRIVLKGSTGSGKTQFALTLAMEILKNYDLQDPNPELNKFFFLSIAKLNEVIFEKEKSYYDKIRKASVLIIDDIGVELQVQNNKTAYILMELDHLIREFEGILIITTNVAENLKEMYEHHNKRLSSVILTDTEENHGINNSLFYTFAQREERRKKKNTGVVFL